MEQNDEGMKLNYTGQNEDTMWRQAGADTDIKYKRKAGQRENTWKTQLTSTGQGDTKLETLT